MKECTKCKIEKDISEFSFRNKIKEKYHSECKLCTAERNKEAYKTDSRKISIRKAAKTFQEKSRLFVNNYKEEKGCFKCKDTRYYVLEFHHNSDKEENISDMVSKGCSIETILKEIEKCNVVCANCHKEIHHFQRLGQVS